MGTHQNLKALSGIDIWISLYYSGGKKKTKKQEKTISPAKPLAPANKYLSQSFLIEFSWSPMVIRPSSLLCFWRMKTRETRKDGNLTLKGTELPVGRIKF